MTKTMTTTTMIEITYGIERLDGGFSKVRSMVVPIDRIDAECLSLEMDGYTIIDTFDLP